MKSSVQSNGSFKLDEIAPEVADMLRTAATDIKGVLARQIDDVVAVGRTLTAVKKLLPHGAFGQWISVEFDWSERTARNYMLAAETYGDNRQRVADLPIKVLYRLQGPRVPPLLREDVLRRVDEGERLTARDIDAEIAQAALKQKAAEVEARKTSDRRKREMRTPARRQRELEEWRLEQDQRERASKLAAELVLAQMPQHVDDLLALLVNGNNWSFIRALKAARAVGNAGVE